MTGARSRASLNSQEESSLGAQVGSDNQSALFIFGASASLRRRSVAFCDSYVESSPQWKSAVCLGARAP